MAIQQTFEFLSEASTPNFSSPSTALPAASRTNPPRVSSPRLASRPSQKTLVSTQVSEADFTLPREGEMRCVDTNAQKEGEVQVPTTTLDQLRDQIGCITAATTPTDHQPKLSTGSGAIDGMIPAGGLRFDAITEWVAAADGSAAAALSLIAAAECLRQTTGPLVVVCPPDYFYPPAAVALGIPATRIIWVRPNQHADTVWSIDQALRCSAVAAVWAPVAARLDDRDARRFQLAAEIGNTPGLLIRPAAVRGRPTFADIRFHIAPAASIDGNRTIQITLDRCRGGQIGLKMLVQISDTGNILQVTSRDQHESTPLHLASQLAQPTRISQRSERRRA